jgi:hypothetical protein
MAGDVNRLFPPQHPDAASAQAALLNVVRRDPHQLGYARSRWSLPTLLDSCRWLRLRTTPGLGQLLQRLGIHYKRGREYVHSPDAHYLDKLALIASYRQQVAAEPQRYVLIYIDELTYYQQPSLSYDYERQGHQQPLARRSYQRNRWFRIVAGLNALTGQVTYRQRSRVTAEALADFWTQLVGAYPQAERIFVVLDNWPVHFHPDALVGLEPQTWSWPPYVPATWRLTRPPPPVRLPIQLLCLPTYASWCNPIEKLWRWLKQELLHQHRLSHDWTGLKEEVQAFLDRFQGPSPELLRYTGLLLG